MRLLFAASVLAAFAGGAACRPSPEAQPPAGPGAQSGAAPGGRAPRARAEVPQRSLVVGRSGEAVCAVQRGRVACLPESVDEMMREHGLADTEGVVDIAMGRNGTCVVWNGGRVRCLDTRRDGAPVLVDVPDLRDAVRVEILHDVACAIRREGKLSCWRDDERALDVRVPGPVVAAVEGHGEETCIVLRDGQVACAEIFAHSEGDAPRWQDPFAEVGAARCQGWGSVIECIVRVKDRDFWTRSSPGEYFDSGEPLSKMPPVPFERTYAPGRFCDIDHAGRVRCVGRNDDLVLGSSDRAATDVQVALPAEAVEIQAGGRVTCVRLADARVYCWGDNTRGQIGWFGAPERVDRPHRVAIDPARALLLHARGTCANVGRGGASTWWCWGRRRSPGGESLGSDPGPAVPGEIEIHRNPPFPPCSLERGVLSCELRGGDPEPVVGADERPLTGVRDFVGWRGHGALVDRKGHVRVWGRGPGLEPVARETIHAPTKAVSLASDLGGLRGCASFEDGSMWCWEQAACDDPGDARCEPPPPRRQPFTRPARIAMGRDHTCIIDRAGRVWCMGDNRYGQLGAPKPARTTEPIAVRGIGKATDLKAGELHTCALTTEGAVWCWGDDGEGATGKPRVRWIPEPRSAELPTAAR